MSPSPAESNKDDHNIDNNNENSNSDNSMYTCMHVCMHVCMRVQCCTVWRLCACRGHRQSRNPHMIVEIVAWIDRSAQGVLADPHETCCYMRLNQDIQADNEGAPK